MIVIHRQRPVDNAPHGQGGRGTLEIVTPQVHHVTHCDPRTLLRRVGRHVPFEAGRVILALVRLSRSYVERAGWVDEPDDHTLTLAEVHALVHDALDPLVPPGRTHPPTHAITVVRCRPGRVIWLPSDERWVDAATFGARTRGLPLTDAFLVSEHGWRTRVSGVADRSPSLPARRLSDACGTGMRHAEIPQARWLGTLST
ncbi:hypothetical protein DFJ64_3375 [Thermasporomyces composti]|jgi:hypothetical protein|uniref:Uncharacterized protein n=1 Tax=Thermasporomyces composti TaxID=696763 RepID=A0A3D9VI72_THECX|nr:hypothetical protein DFJ64_3375 [Thermasporomyces composti]